MARDPSDVDRLAESYLDELIVLDPVLGTYLGVPGHDGEFGDLSPDGLAEHSALRQRTLAALDASQPVDANDRITIAALREELEVAELIRAAGADESELNNIASPVQQTRDVFDLMATATADDWATIATRLSHVSGRAERLR